MMADGTEDARGDPCVPGVPADTAGNRSSDTRWQNPDSRGYLGVLRHLSPLVRLSPHLQLPWSEMKRCLHAKILQERLSESVLEEPFLAAMVNPRPCRVAV